MKAFLRLSTRTASLLLASTAIIAPSALAQTVPSADGTQPAGPDRNPTPTTPSAVESEADVKSNENDGIGDIVVTALKRSQSINTVGMAINALSSDQLVARGVADTADLARVIPGLNFSSSQKGAPIYTLRGVGFYEESLGASPAVSVYVDEANYSVPIMAKAATMDLERVEVLKGPQGTLFGQNSTGGAINYIAAKPTSTLRAGINAGIARFGRFSTDGFISGPVTSTLGMRVSYAVDQGGAWQRSASRGDRNGSLDVFKVRLITEWNPTSNFTATLNLNSWRDRSDTIAVALIGITPQAPARATPAILSQRLVPPRLGLVDWTASPDLRSNQRFWQSALRLNWRLSDAFQITSITNNAQFRQRDYRDTDGSPLEIFAVNQRGLVKSFQQELRASGLLLEDRLNYVFGGYFADDRARESNRYNQRSATSTNSPIPLGLPAFFGPFTETSQKTVTKAVFGNLDYDLSDRFALHGGVRHSWSDIDFEACMRDDGEGKFANFISAVGRRINPAFQQIAPGGCVTILPATRQAGLYVNTLREQSTSWRLGLDFKPIARTLFYATISKGFKAGSFPHINATTEASFAPVTQESVLAYELGFKSDLGLRVVQLNGALFYYDYKDKQLRGRVVDPLGVFGAVEALVNVPKSRVKGAEFNLTAQPMRGLELQVGATYLDTAVTSNLENFNPYGAQANFQGEPFPFTPKWSVQGSADYKWDLTSAMEAFVGLSASYRSDTTSAFGRNAVNSPFPYSLVLVDPYTLVDGQLGVADPGGRWRVTGFVRNLMNKYYFTDAFRQIDNVSRHVGEPRTYGVRVNYNF